MAFFTKEQENAIMAAMPHCEATRWNPLFSDIIPKGSSKQVGVDRMLDYFWNIIGGIDGFRGWRK